MAYSIQEIDVQDPAIEHQLINLFKDAFGMETPVPAGYIYKNTVTEGSLGKTLFLGAVEDGKIIGCNVFMATDFSCNGALVTAYQSCWSATHPIHQGRKIFATILNESKEILKERGGGFIYGVPNDNSYPIFIKKLGFKETPAVMLKIFNVPIVRNSYFSISKKLDINELHKNAYLPVEAQIMTMKRNLAEYELLEVREGKSMLWGKCVKKTLPAGITLTYFYVGGIELAQSEDLKNMIKKIFSTYSVHYIHIVSCQSNTHNALLKGWVPAKINSFIHYGLHAENLEHLNLYYGAIDVF